MYYVLIAVYVLVCLLLLLVVLLQQGKGGDIAAAFGGSSSQTAFGARAGATVLTRATAILGTLFMLGAFTLSFIGPGAGSSVVSGIQGPATTPAPVQLPNIPGAPATTPPAATATPPGTPTPTATTKPTPTKTPPAGK